MNTELARSMQREQTLAMRGLVAPVGDGIIVGVVATAGALLAGMLLYSGLLDCRQVSCRALSRLEFSSRRRVEVNGVALEQAARGQRRSRQDVGGSRVSGGSGILPSYILSCTFWTTGSTRQGERSRVSLGTMRSAMSRRTTGSQAPPAEMERRLQPICGVRRT